MDTLLELKNQREELNMKIELLEYAESTFQEGEVFWFVDAYGNIQQARWNESVWIKHCFYQGHIFNTEQEARLEVQRRNLLQRFKMFRDKCNDGWKPDFNDHNSKKWVIAKNEEGMYAMWTVGFNSFSYFGCFKNQFDAKHAIKLFGDEIKELFVDCEVQ
jgi:hypothetical protein